MKIENIENNRKLEFDILDEDVSIVNSLRRTLMTDIESLVFRGFPHDSNNINIEINNSRFHNEYIKQRISCIPVLYNVIEKFDIFVNNYYFEVNVKNESDEKILVTTNDFKLYDIKSKEPKKKNYFPKYEKNGIPICYLYPRVNDNEKCEEIKIKMNLYVGTQKEDACWNMVSKCLYYNIEDNTKIEEIKKSFKPDSIELKDFQILDSQRYYKKNQYHMVIESVGVFENIDLIKLACKKIIYKLENLIKEMNNNNESFKSPQTLLIDDEKIYHLYKEKTSEDVKYILRLENEDYTLGKLIEKHLSLEIYKYVAFLKEHPHDSYSFIKFIFKNKDVSDINVINELVKTLQLVIDKYKKIIDIFKE